MKIKNICAGTMAFSVKYYPKERKYEIEEHRIMRVGRKYVYVDGFSYPFYFQDAENDFLVENKDWGGPARFFVTETAAEEYIERQEAIKIIHRACCDYWKLEKLTLEQMRIIRDALIEEPRK